MSLARHMTEVLVHIVEKYDEKKHIERRSKVKVMQHPVVRRIQTIFN